jgi:hypothetical protein
MKPHSPESAWRRLAAAAAKAPDSLETSAPFGFASRVVARAFERQQPSFSTVLDRLSWRALAVSCVLTAICIASSYSSWASLAEEESVPQDPVSEIIEHSAWF